MKKQGRADMRAQVWREHWKPYFDKFVDEDGVTLSQAMMFEIVLCLNGILVSYGEKPREGDEWKT